VEKYDIRRVAQMTMDFYRSTAVQDNVKH
jgi:hypothetical protein